VQALVVSALRRVIACAVVAVAALTGHWLVATVLAVALAGAYAYSIRAMPEVPCWLCSGSGTRTHRGLLGWLFPRGLGRCLRCKGGKVTTRWGARALGR
jgi:hypothetical protein